MGQRLTIQIFKNKEQEQPLATLYYHWSAYTESALEELKTFYNNYLHYFIIQKKYQKAVRNNPTQRETTTQKKDLDAIVVSIYQAVTKTGGGLISGEAEKAIQLYPVLNKHYDPDNLIDRSNGLVAFTEEEQNDFYSWSEGNIKLYLNEQEFQFDVYSIYDINDALEYYDPLIKKWFNTQNIDDITYEQIVDYYTNNLPKLDDAQYYNIDDIDSLSSTFEQSDTFYDANEELIIRTIR